MGAFYEDVFTFMTISRCFLLRVINVSNKKKRMVEPDRTQTIWPLRVVYWISEPTRAQKHACACVPLRTHARAHRNVHNTYCFHDNGFVNVPHCYVIRSLPVLLRDEK